MMGFLEALDFSGYQLGDEIRLNIPASVENGGKTPTHGSQPVTGRVKFEDSLCVFGLFGCGSLR